MRTRTILTIPFLGLLILGCAGAATTASPDTATPSPAATESPAVSDGVEGLVADLTDAGAEASVTGEFDGEPLASEALIVCVNGRDVRVYSYSSEQERAAVSARIDPDDPSNIGLAIVEWDGWPQFWQRDRILILYLGSDEETIDLLTSVLGAPFAQGQPRPQRLPGGC